MSVSPGARICLVGRNGSGKSTFLKIAAGLVEADQGEVFQQPDATVRYLPQEPDFSGFADVNAYVEAGLAPGDEPYRAQLLISELGLNGYENPATMSGGERRRAALARTLAPEPDILLLDEPTNHLDISSITWLEGFLKSYGGTLLFITHDRSFLQALATRIVQLDRGQLVSFPGDYKSFLEKREALLSAEAEQNAQFDKKLAQEEVWIRQGIKARRTRNEGRVRALEKLRRERGQRREVLGNVSMKIQEGDRSGKLVVEVENISQAFDGRQLFKDFSTVIQRGDRIGIIGPNGCGKSTLLSILLGRAEPQSGTVRLGTNLQVAYFDQLRSQLDEEASVVDNVGQGRDFVEINGSPKHVIGYLQDLSLIHI